MVRKKTYVFQSGRKEIRITPTHTSVFQGEKGRAGEMMYLFYIADYEKQELESPYVQIFSNGSKVHSETWYQEKEAKAIFDFFAAAHLLSPPSILKK